MSELLPPSLIAIALYFLIKYLWNFNKEMTKSSREEENTIKGNTFTMRDETLEEKNDPLRKLVEEAERVSDSLKKQDNKHK